VNRIGHYACVRVRLGAWALVVVALGSACSSDPKRDAHEQTSPPRNARVTQPVLGRATAPNQRGYGSARPRVIGDAGDQASLVEGVRWQSWGQARAVATGMSSYDAPGDGVAYAVPSQATVVAFDLGSCSGVPSYNGFEVFFPLQGQVFNPNSYRNTCTAASVRPIP
jgi:hypothetical protein